MQRDLILRNNSERLCLQRQLWLAMVAAERNREFLKTYTSFVWGDLSHYYRTWKMRCFVERPMKGVTHIRVAITYTLQDVCVSIFRARYCGVLANIWLTPHATLASTLPMYYTNFLANTPTHSISASKLDAWALCSTVSTFPTFWWTWSTWRGH